MRFSDNITQSITPDFVPRGHNKPLQRLMLFYLLAILAICATNYFSHIFGPVGSAAIIIVVLAALAINSFIFSQRNNDLRMATEFENSLFSAGLSANALFTIFIKHDGTIVYADNGTKQMFPRFAYEESRALDGLVEGRVDKTDIERIYTALTTGRSEKLVVPIIQNDEESQFIFLIEPLKRPVGYFVLRGRNYYPERTSVAPQATSLGTASPEKIGKLLEQTTIAAYVTDQHGNLEYCSRALASMLGYTPEAILEKKLNISNIIYEAEGYSTGDFGITDFSGNILLQQRIGTLNKAVLNQQIFRDAEGRQSGCIAIITETD